MLSRSIHVLRSLFNVMFDPTLIPELAPIEFSHTIADIYQPHPDDTTGLKINQITYSKTTKKICIITAPTTENDFLVCWHVSLFTCNTLLMPTLTLLVQYEDGSIFTRLPTSGNRKTETLFDTTFLHLPSPSPEVGRIKYYISIINETGGECYYSTRTLQVASILIVSLDTN